MVMVTLSPKVFFFFTLKRTLKLNMRRYFKRFHRLQVVDESASELNSSGVRYCSRHIHSAKVLIGHLEYSKFRLKYVSLRSKTNFAVGQLGFFRRANDPDTIWPGYEMTGNEVCMWTCTCMSSFLRGAIYRRTLGIPGKYHMYPAFAYCNQGSNMRRAIRI